MKNIIAIAATFLLIATIGQSADKAEEPAKSEVYLIIKHSDHAKKTSYKLMSQSEYKALQDEITAEAKLWDKAMSAAEKAWKEDTTTSKKMFPRNAVSPQKASIDGKYTDQQKAGAKITSLEKAAKEDEDADKKRADEKRTRLNQNNPNIKKKEPKGSGDRDALFDSARSLFETKMAELISKAAEKAGAAPAAHEEPAAKKKGDAK